MEQPVILSSLLPFPPLSWWMAAAGAQLLVWDVHEHYEKMSRRSRYRIATAHGALQLSVPLAGGRDQRTPVGRILIDNRQPWARTHWRTIRTAYRRAPFFEHFEASLEGFFSREFIRLADFNTASVAWLCDAARISFPQQESISYEKINRDKTDVRDERLQEAEAQLHFARYSQVFGDRHDFIPNLSALDLLFTEGPEALRTLSVWKG